MNARLDHSTSHAADDDDDHRPLERAVARAAAEWLVRLADNPTPEDIDACTRWRAANPEHARAWRRAERLNAKFEVLPAKVGMSALARAERGKSRAGIGSSIGSGVDHARRRAALKTLSLLLAAGPTGWLAWRTTPWRVWCADARTGTGERRTLVLADGTHVELNTVTALDVAFDARERRVRLDQGEIIVDTAPDPQASARPFIVQTDDGRIRALGTRFVVRDVHGLRGNGGTQVAVFHGAVEVTPADAPHLARIVGAGQQTRFTADSIGPITGTDPHGADWTRGVLFAQRVRLADFLAELSRYRAGLVRCDPAIADLHISGAFQLADTDNILAALPETLPVQVIWRTRYWVTVVPGPQAPQTGAA
ncbi:transmembrane sensor [Paraburkholderia bannensis]|uniref:Transmembrane sensor n=1 Tax=Paraburkholderia bannensis TaxID=765414 RepID=A0A7W9U4T2_9BURK|nr:MULTISPECIES: FecR domain-containing protein [Paraburkholderia]MBB3260740.1 transmembrane sensor [Paraburkholderia sp. WP4_3_2]MBB6105910.1 transmembrane sensor [Paraburkholderia bannensis]